MLRGQLECVWRTGKTRYMLEQGGYLRGIVVECIKRMEQNLHCAPYTFLCLSLIIHLFMVRRTLQSSVTRINFANVHYFEKCFE